MNNPFSYFLSTGSELHLQLGSQSWTGNMCHEYLKKLYFGQWKYINKGNNKITELRTILQKESQNS
jgi:hypothetical protein